MRYILNQKVTEISAFPKVLKKTAYMIQISMKRSGNAACISTKGMKYML